MEHRFFTEEPNSTNYEQIDLTLRLSPYGSVPAAEGEKGLVRFGDLQTMRRVRSGKRLVLEKQRREYELKMAWHNLNMSLLHISSDVLIFAYIEEGASSSIQTSPKEEYNPMVTPKESMLLERLEHVNPRLEGDDAMDILRQMPRVTTTGDGPNGKRIEGLLHKYKGGQVCIVCVCHGSFLSPTEFVMHAGGKEVANPMTHITVCSDSFCII
ncbi:ninja-family protein AFP3-like isoform X1 [Lotus japonicus]|uniref:ninja-family protein AFP3-like isoform X1 n=1 Tax=Lotus japonicus TaxID=34305 RepID=UPI002586CC13|nr:ninja-family protein AFP3-like isoform X1 [Lotus japonicus]